MSLSKKTEEYNRIITDRWHTPGHKGYLWADDITEIANGQYFPDGLIQKAESEAAKVYGVKHLRFLTGGSSMGIKASILAADCELIAGSYSHKAVFGGAALGKLKLNLIENTVKDDVPQPLTSEQIENAIKKYPDANAVIIESPNYFGQVVSGEALETVKKHNKLLIVDSAHGAHFIFDEELFPEASCKKADFCNMSAHKTLCSLTMGAYLTVNNENYISSTDKALENLGTTSPLYPLLSSLERAVEIGFIQKKIYKKLFSTISQFKKNIPCLKNDDFTRIAVDAKALNTDGESLYKKLLNAGIAAEMFTERYVVFIATPFDDDVKFARLEKALK